MAYQLIILLLGQPHPQVVFIFSIDIPTCIYSIILNEDITKWSAYFWCHRKGNVIIFISRFKCFHDKLRLPGVEPGSIAWKAIILTVGLQTLLVDRICYSPQHTLIGRKIQHFYYLTNYQEKIKKIAFAGSRTRVYCLEGNYPNRWTTNATF
ncbi:hypothetical protein MTR_5g030170 [Medicago truncatula]|uniref:Uncharacterized protein n=1 Tax=Medicago truncatula TaxID=3880 RepID=G7KDT0_MEDTR|nr:hypothetical protein MTR_5g030170 [Medicago truncatula]